MCSASQTFASTVAILRVPDRRGPDEASAGDRVGGREQGHVESAGDEPLGQERRELLPRAVVARRHPPRDRREHGDAQVRARRPRRYLPREVFFFGFGFCLPDGSLPAAAARAFCFFVANDSPIVGSATVLGSGPSVASELLVDPGGRSARVLAP